MKYLSFIIFSVFTVLTHAVWRMKRQSQVEGMTFPTDCPGGGTECVEKVFSSSQNLMELFSNLRRQFPWAEIQLDIEDQPIDAHHNTPRQCNSCKNPTSLKNSEASFKISLNNATDANGCAIREVTCTGPDGYALEGTHTRNGIITCTDEKNWQLNDKPVISLCAPQECPCPNLVLDENAALALIAYDSNGCQVQLLQCINDYKIGENSTPGRINNGVACCDTTTKKWTINKKLQISSDRICFE